MKIDVIDGVDTNLTSYHQARLAGFSDKIFVMDIKICNAIQVQRMAFPDGTIIDGPGSSL